MGSRVVVAAVVGIAALSGEVVLTPAGSDSPAHAQPQATPPVAISLEALLARLAGVPGFRADFHESKRVALLRRPIESEGTLHFAPPSRLARHVRTPSWSSIVVDGDRLVLASAAEHRELGVAGSGAARPFLDGFRALLRGDRPALDHAFVCTFVAESASRPWELTLRPRAAGPIRAVVVSGHDRLLLGYRIDESSGDVTEVSFQHVDSSHRYSASEARRVFRPQAP